MQAPRMTTPPVSRTAGGRPMRLGKTRAVKNWARGEEPAVSEILDDPVMCRLLARDNIEPDRLRSFMDDMRNRLLRR